MRGSFRYSGWPSVISMNWSASDVVERLRQVAGRPEDLQPFHLLSPTQANFLTRGIAAKAPSTVYMLVDRPPFTVLGQLDPDARPEARAVGTHAYQLDFDPVVGEPRVLEERVPKRISGKEPPHLLEDILVTIVVQVGEHNGVALLQMPKPTAGGDVSKALPSAIAIHQIGHQRLVVGMAGSHIKIKKSVVVQVSEVGAHGEHHPVQVLLNRHMCEAALAITAVKSRKLGSGSNAEIFLYGKHHIGLHERPAVCPHEQVQSAVVIVVPKPCGDASKGACDPELFGNIRKGSVPVVVI